LAMTSSRASSSDESYSSVSIKRNGSSHLTPST
jgi:hypothetical protein